MEFIETELEELKNNNLYRSMRSVVHLGAGELMYEGKRYVNFSSNDYLCLSRDERVKAKACEGIIKFGVGSGSSRLIAGTMEPHVELEKKLSVFKHSERALVFPTGYMANIGLVCSLVEKDDAIIIDRLNHASIIDAAYLSKAKLYVYPHKDMDALKKLLIRSSAHRRRLIITDSLFSMDGDLAPLDEIKKLAHQFGAMMLIDEAHATGVFGKNGRGAAEHFCIEDSLAFSMGTLSKAVGCQGGFASGSHSFIDYIINRARTFIYTTGLSPALCWAACESLRIIMDEPERRIKLLERSEYARNKIKALGFDTLDSCSQIIPVLTKDIKTTMAIAARLLENGMFVLPIRPPTVHKDMCRLRISLTHEHSKEQIDRLTGLLKECA